MPAVKMPAKKRTKHEICTHCTRLLEKLKMPAMNAYDEYISSFPSSMKANMSNATDPNFGCVGGGNGFEEWACDDFNLLEYVGKDSSPLFDELDNNDEDDSLRKKDMIYSTWQINNALLPQEHGTGTDSRLSNWSEGVRSDSSTLEHYNDIPYYDPNAIPMRIQNLASMDDRFSVGVQENNLMVPSTSKSSPILLPPKVVKMEPTADQTGFDSVYEYDNNAHQNKLKPRKYRVKPDSEKRNPHYRAKREKNNDAVRKSRDKAKRLQEEKDERLSFLEKEFVKQSKLIDQLRQRNEFLETQLLNVKRGCVCRNAR